MQRLYEQFKPSHYDVKWDLTQASKKTITGSVRITGEQCADDTITLHSKDITIKNLLVNDTPAEYKLNDDDTLVIYHSGIGSATITIEFSLALTDAMHGIYPCYFDYDGEKKELYATQFESHHAREAFPCIDEPEAKATFGVTLLTKSGVGALSNMPIDSADTVGDNTMTSFTTTPQMSSYLLAFVVGDLHKKSGKTSNGIEVNVWATPAQSPAALDFALDHAIKSIEFFDEYFGVPYPLPKSDHVALPDFSSGAMENWGLITYREIALLADPATTTVASKQYIATVISHELSHQWFGNLVTMKWWNDLWLNESFATLMEYIAVDAIHPEWNAWLDFATHESIMALRRDAMDGVQSVQVAVAHPDEISTLFDGAIVYAKGARLMRMCQDYIGDEAFRNGLSSYFKEFAYKNTDADDLWRHLSNASGQDISALMHTWISQSGYPVVHVRPDGLSQEQFFIGEHTPSTKLWPIPLCSEGESKLPALLTTRELPIDVAADERLNIRDSAHFITHYPADHLARLLDNASTYNELGRLQLLHEQTLLVRGGIVPSAELLDLLLAYKSETSQSVWDIMAVTLGELKKFVETNEEAEAKLRSFALALALPEFTRLGWDVYPGEPESDTKLRGLILGMMLYGEDSAVLDHADMLFRQGVETINPEVRSLVISSAVRYTHDPDTIDDLLNLYRITPLSDLREDICSGLSSVRKPEYIQQILGCLTDNKTIRSQDIFRWFAYLIRNRYARDATWQWMVDNWQWIERTFTGDKSYDDFPRYAASGLVTREQLASYKAFFQPLSSVPALARAISIGTAEIQARVELIERDSEAVCNKLSTL